MTLGERIKLLRKNRNIIQEDIAKMFQVDRSTVASWETDRALPDVNTLKRIAEFFNVTTDYLLGHHTTDTKSHTLANEINELPEEKRKMIEAMIRFMKSEQESGDGIKNNVSLLDQ